MHRHSNRQEEGDFNDPQDEKSRTRIKNEDRELQKLGERLITLNQAQLSAIDIPQELKDAVADARGIRSHQARRRQIQFIGVLMRSMDTTPVTRAFELLEAGVSIRKKKPSEAPVWLERLVAGDDLALDDVARACPDTDRQKLRQLTRNARKSAGTPAAAKSVNHLKRYLEELASSSTPDISKENQP